MKKLILFLLLVGSGSLLAQRTITDTITSQKLNEDREIKIGLPPSYDKNKSQKYPLLILFDGDFLFDAFQGALSYGYYWDDLPEVIIVGISQNKNNERETDCTVDETTGLPSEKGADFFEFIGMELIPSIQKNFRAAPFRIAAGLDTTAGFLNCYLYKDQPIFNAFISMSPELPTGMEEQIPERLAAVQQTTFYYHCTADGDMKKMRTRIQAMDAEIKKINNPKLNYVYEEFKGASHYSLVLHAIPSALYQIFSVYQPISTAEFQEKIAVLPSGYVKYLTDKYDMLEKVLGLKLQIRINDFKAIEAAILKNKAYPEFDQLSQLARKNYPKSMLADYHLAQLYEKTGDLKRAIKSYQTAFQKEEIGDLTKDMMLERADALKGAAKAKAEEPVEEVPATDAPAETPTETPVEEKKSE
ncbi:alpha/beta hydrolase-fold protein [Flavobacterium sedimenticola]|uniref:Alpha/beta hydrolase-fold protein n=1 Tax=Flavobacterium sedimenticola TaxID=3043286 RepID=A0ABT6XMQ7_9FLAO|nr:alpha/beta hydrolase-fold protein [Flavobacterium sedimenticola]MDI9256275.1 alpha/beta hydrolase-fold protein [Flavobacterium sedimenticola]